MGSSVLLIATQSLPAGVALILAREAGHTYLAVSPDLTANQLLAAEAIAFAHPEAGAVVLVSELVPMA